MATKKVSSTRRKGRVKPTIPRAGFRGDGSRYGNGGTKRK